MTFMEAVEELITHHGFDTIIQMHRIVCVHSPNSDKNDLRKVLANSVGVDVSVRDVELLQIIIRGIVPFRVG